MDGSAGTVDLATLLHDGDPADAVLVVDERRWRRHELVRSSDVLTGVAAQLGVGPGVVVASCLPSNASAIVAAIGTWRAGAAFAPLNPRLTDAELRSMVTEIDPGVVLVAAGDPRAREVFAGRTVVEVDPAMGWRADATSATSTATATVSTDVALVLYTSGTTARPKPVLLRRSTLTTAMSTVVRSIRTTASAPAGGGPVRPPMPNIVAFPLYLWSGIYNVCFALLQRSLVVALSGFDPHQLSRAIRRYEVRSVVLAPAMVAALVDSDVDDLAPLRFVRNGTAAVAPSVVERFEERFGVTVLNGYGQTELGGEVAGWSVPDVKEFGTSNRGAAGRAHPGITIRIVDDSGREVPPDVDGEVAVRSPFAMAGYLGATDPSRLSGDGSILTGDLGHLDPDGFLWLTGRRSDVINRSGNKVFPDQVEDVLRGHPAVADVAVVGGPDERLGEVPWAFVVLRPQTMTPTPQLDTELTGLARTRLAAYKVPVGYRYVERLPRNEIGKVLRRVLAAELTET